MTCQQQHHDLEQAHRMRSEATRARRLSLEDDRCRLARYAEELDREATRLEKAAAKPGRRSH